MFFEQVALSGVVPQVAAVMGPTAAGSSYIAALADYTPMVAGVGSMALAGPPLVKAAIGEVISTEELGSKLHCEISGCGDGEFADDQSCIAGIRKVSKLPSLSCRRPAAGEASCGGFEVDDQRRYSVVAAAGLQKSCMT